jgi:hypothetical protein
MNEVSYHILPIIHAYNIGMSWLWSYLLTSVMHHGSGWWACHMSYHLSCERLCMLRLDDCSILQPEHLVRSRLRRTHDSFSIRNISISQLHKFKCQAMSCDQWTLSPAWSERNLSIQKDSVPLQLGWIKVFECLVRRAKALCSATMALRTDHTREKSLAQQTEQGPGPSHQRLWMLYELGARRYQSWGLSWEILGEKSRLSERTGNYDSYAWRLRMCESKRLSQH